MKKVIIFSLISNITLFSQELQVDKSMPWMLPWLIGALLVVGLFFWSFYKAIKTKNPKYGYLILLSFLLMLGMLFI